MTLFQLGDRLAAVEGEGLHRRVVYKPDEKTDYGPTVVDGFVRRTSVSALTAFDPKSYAGCPARWWWQRVGGKKEPETKSQGMGKQIHKELETYLKTGQDVLSPIARAGKHLLPKPGSDLIVEAQFGDFGTAIALRDHLNPKRFPYGELGMSDGAAREVDRLRVEMRDAAGLVAGDIPLDGYIDLRHARGEWVDNSGVVRREESHLGKVVVVSDHKTTSSIDDYAKSPGELAETPQMVGYAKYVLNVVPDVDHVRVEHNYFQTRGSKVAKKMTTLLSRGEIEKRWRRVDELAVYMEEVARQTDVRNVEMQPKSCTSYREGCPHRAYCPVKLSFGTKHADTSTSTHEGEPRMTLFGNVMKQQTTNGTHANGAATQAPPAPTQAPPSTTSGMGSLFGSIAKPAAQSAPDRAAVDAEKARLAAEDAGQAAPVAQYGFCAECGTKLDARNASKLASGTVKHVGCTALSQQTVQQPATVAPGQIVPPDAARPTLAQTANPLPPAALAGVTDPEILARNEAVKQAHAEAAAKGEATGAKSGGGRCPAGGTVHKVTPKEATTRKTKCPECGVEYKIKDEEFNESFDAVTLRNHNRPKVEVVQQPTTPTAAAPMQQPTPSAAAPMQQPTTPAAAPMQQPASQAHTSLDERRYFQGDTGAVQILVDCLKERGVRPVPLEDYWRPMVAELEKQAGGSDLRCAPNDSPMAYGKWRGYLTQWVREKPPVPGVYFARGLNEFDAVVVDALAGVADVTRGVR